MLPYFILEFLCIALIHFTCYCLFSLKRKEMVVNTYENNAT